MTAWAIAIHGGAGAIPTDLSAERAAAVSAVLGEIVDAAKATLCGGASAIDVVQQAVEALEDNPQFNAGHGAVLTADGTHELEASIMCGRTGKAGAALLLRSTRHPVAAARLVMDQSEHVMLAGTGAESLAIEHGLGQVDNSFFTTEHRAAALRRFLAKEDVGPHHATVGAVALDQHGHLAAATSTGGTTGKRPGRIGDAPVIGAGTWADARVAVSCTGVGEHFLQHGTARRVSDRIEFCGETLEAASRAAMHELPAASGGLIAVDVTGAVSLPFTSAGMYRGCASMNSPTQVGIGPT